MNQPSSHAVLDTPGDCSNSPFAMERISPTRSRSPIDELRELRDIAAREHGPRARSTRLIEEAIRKETAGIRDGPAERIAPTGEADRPTRDSVRWK